LDDPDGETLEAVGVVVPVAEVPGENRGEVAGDMASTFKLAILLRPCLASFRLLFDTIAAGDMADCVIVSVADDEGDPKST
jgi:hypothetical protein